MDKELKKVVVLLAHPDIEKSNANKALLDAINDIEAVARPNLYVSGQNACRGGQTADGGHHHGFRT